MSLNNKRIIISSNLYLPNIGGVENSMRYLAIEYANLGYQVDIVCSDMNNVNNTILPSIEELAPNITIYRYKTQHNFIPKSLYMYYSSTRLFVELKKRNQYEFIFSRYHFNVISAWLAGFRDIRYLLAGVVKKQRVNERLNSDASLLQKTSRELNNHYHHLLQKVALKCAKSLAVFSNNMLEQISEVFPSNSNKINIFKPGIAVERFKPIEQGKKDKLKDELLLPKDKIILLGLGRFVESKGFSYAIEALRLLPENYILCLVGEGAEKELYQKLSSGLKQRLFFFDKTNKPEVFFQVSDIFVLSSIYETLGQTALEAQSCGVPIVAFTPSPEVVTSTLEITDDQTKVLSQTFDAKGFAEAIELANKKVQSNELDSKYIRQFVCDKFSWHTLSKNIKNLSEK